MEAYIQARVNGGSPRPQVFDEVDRHLKDLAPFDLIYRVDDDLYIHILQGDQFPDYIPIEPVHDEAIAQVCEEVRDRAFDEVVDLKVPASTEEFEERLMEIMDRTLRKRRIKDAVARSVRYYVRRDLLRAKRMDPLIADPWIEDIHCIGTTPIWVVHKVFAYCRSHIRFRASSELDAYVKDMAEGMGRPVSEARPIIDGALPDGSRINIIFSETVSKGGTSFTIRKFSDTPISLTQLIAWGTLDERIGAYLWLCMEYGQSIFVSGETASGKTTTLNACLPLVPPNRKVLSAEDTPEVRPPHNNWQQLVTRDGGDEGVSVDTDDLLRVGLRARPDLIIVGEIRGAEGAVAFQAMQTGYPTMATFHASSVAKLIQRFTSDPINVPPQFMPNLQVVLVQLAVHVGGRRLRRVIEVEEIEGYSRRIGSPITRQVFRWDPSRDRHEFGGRNNSYVLENLVAPKMGLKDSRLIYKELDRRAAILAELVRQTRFDYMEIRDHFRGIMSSIPGAGASKETGDPTAMQVPA